MSSLATDVRSMILDMPSSDRESAVTGAIADLSGDQRTEVLKTAISTLDDEQLKKVGGVIPQPSQKMADALWFVVFGILGLVILGGGFLAFEAADADETALYGFVGTALGAIVGVLVPSPSMPSTSKK